jgi:hypothetical protein
MAVSYDQLAGYLDDVGFHYHRPGSAIEVLFGTNHFVNPQDDTHALDVFIAIDDDASAVRFTVPRVNDLRTAANHGAVCELLASINLQTRSLRWEVDRLDGEVRAAFVFLVAVVAGVAVAAAIAT